MKPNVSPTLNPFSNILTNIAPQYHGKSSMSTQSTVNKLPQGAKMIGNYLLGKNIGQGSFGKVHLAMHIPTSQKVAIKIIDKSKMRPKDVIRVKSQIQILKKINHRNIMSLYEIIQTEKSLLLVTQFLPNGQLFRHIIKQKKLPQDQACAYFQQIIQAVQYLHKNKIAHRDLKPENILIDADRQIKIIDFGLSSFYDKKNELKTFCGSPCYAAPQMIQAKNPYNPVFVDIWSCGVILFAMLCGHLPFCDADTNTLFKKIMSCTFKFPSNTNISQQAKDLISNLLVLSPEKRLSLQEIKEHKWFSRVSPSISYGLNLGEKLPLDSQLVCRVKGMGIDEKKLKQNINKNEKSKDVATYFILMKKLVKSGQFIPTYIGNDNFNNKLIIKAYQKILDQQDTQSYGQVLLQTPEPPAIPQISQQKQSMGEYDQWWYANHSQEQIKNIDQSELMLLANSILDIFLPKKQSSKPQIKQIRQILAPQPNQHPLKRINHEKRADQFYQQNKAHGKKRFEMHEEDEKNKTIQPKLRRKLKPLSLRSQFKKSSSKQGQIEFKKNVSELLIDQRQKTEIRTAESILPHILNKIDPKPEFKIKDVNKRYQLYRNYNS